jgi:hypothetical protein
MKKQPLFPHFITISVIAFLFAACSGSGKDAKIKKQNDSLDSIKIIVDSIKKAEAIVPKYLVIQGTNVNMRVEPNLNAVRIKQLKTGDTCFILEKGNKETIDDKTNFWYKIKRKNKEGWIFGAFTSLKLPAEPDKQKNSKISTTIKK